MKQRAMIRTLIASASVGSSLVAAPVASAPTVAVYYAATGKADAARALPGRRLTHVIYAFLTVCGDHPSFDTPERERRAKLCAGRTADQLAVMTDSGHRAELEALASQRRADPRLKLIGSVGGWGMPLFPALVKSARSRTIFVQSAIAFLRRYPQFDGIDIDWEYPGGGDNNRKLLDGSDRAAEAEAFREFARELRAALDREGRRAGRTYLLTAAVAGYPRSVAGVNWPATQRYFDRLFVMTYDFTPEKSFAERGDYSGGGGLPGHHANLHASRETGGYGADWMIANLAKAGVPRSKMAIGVGFYGREWKDVDWSGGKYPASARSGTFVGTPTYRQMKARNLEGEGFRRGYDAAADAAYYSGDRKFISFDDQRSICAKGEWAMQQGLAGIFAWEATQDDNRLTAAIADSVHRRCPRKAARKTGQ